MRAKETAWKREPGKQVLEVRVRAARLAWLDQPLTWQDGSVRWGSLAPGPDDFRRAHAALFRLHSMPHSGARAFDDFPTWLAQKEAQLALAQELAALSTTPLESLPTAALLPFLTVEARCQNPLPVSPALLLVRRAAEALPLVAAAPPQPLTRFVLGACHRRLGTQPDRPDRYTDAGQRFGVLPDPPLAAALLDLPDGPALLAAYSDLLALLPPRWKSVEDHRTWFRAAPERFVPDLTQLWQSYRRCQPTLEKAPALRPFTETIGRSLATLLATLDFIAAVEGHSQEYFSLTDGIAAFLERIAAFPDEKRAPALRVLTELVPELWNITLEVRERRPTRRAAWVTGRCQEHRHLLNALESTDDAPLVALAYRSGLIDSVPVSDTRLRLVLQALTVLGQAPELGAPSYLRWFVSAYQSDIALQKSLTPLMAALKRLPLAERVRWMDAVLGPLPSTRAAHQQRLPALLALIPFVRRLRLTGHEEDLFNAFATLHAVPPPLRVAYQEALCCVLRTQRDRLVPDNLPFAASFTVGIQPDEPELGAVLTTLATRSLPRHHWQLLDALPVVRRYANAHRILRQALPHQPERCFPLLRELGLSAALPEAFRERLDLTPPETVTLTPDWEPLLNLLPECAPQVHAFVVAQHYRERPATLPPGLAKLLRLPERLATEREYLRTRPELAVRLANVEARLADPACLTAVLQDELRAGLETQLAEAQLSALETQLGRSFSTYLQSTLETPEPPVPATDDWKSAALLAAHVRVNRPLLIRLLQEVLRGNRAWAETLPENQSYLESLAAQGVAVGHWLAESPETLTLPVGTFRLWLARDPLTILQMGNPFDTCLSVWGFNAFSTVANALEANKRVLFVADTVGRIVGRKLLALNAEKALVGFYGYCNCESGPVREAILAAMHDYCLRFAQRCHLTLAEVGPVPTLLAEGWYDDGTVSWELAPPEGA